MGNIRSGTKCEIGQSFSEPEPSGLWPSGAEHGIPGKRALIPRPVHVSLSPNTLALSLDRKCPFVSRVVILWGSRELARLTLVSYIRILLRNPILLGQILQLWIYVTSEERND